MESKITVANVDITLANTEYSYALPPGTRRFKIKLRNPGYPLQLCMVFGGSDTTYYNIAQGKTHEERDIKGTNITLYFRTTANNQKAEIISFK
jgi:hypothetical protein